MDSQNMGGCFPVALLAEMTSVFSYEIWLCSREYCKLSQSINVNTGLVKEHHCSWSPIHTVS